MLILGVDTSLSLLSVALTRDDALLAAVALEGKGSRNEKLLPAIDWLLGESGIDRRSIDLFAVTRGPGSFTGVRIGLATVQGLALVLSRPVCAMSTHEAIAGINDDCIVIDDAGRGESYVSEFAGGREIRPPRLISAGERSELHGNIVEAHQFARRHNVAAACAARALHIVAADRLASYADATPIYGRLAEAEVKLQQKRDG